MPIITEYEDGMKKQETFTGTLGSENYALEIE
jgi:hypothetical protein